MLPEIYPITMMLYSRIGRAISIESRFDLEPMSNKCFLLMRWNRLIQLFQTGKIMICDPLNRESLPSNQPINIVSDDSPLVTARES